MSEDSKQPKQGKKKSQPSLTFSASSPLAAEIMKKSETFEKSKDGSDYEFVVKSDQQKEKKPPRLGMTQDPYHLDNFQGYKIKKKLIPDEVIKEIRSTDHLVASILRARGNTMSMFGHIRKDRFDIGIEVKIKPEFEKEMTAEQIAIVQDRIARFEQDLINCGKESGLSETDKMSLPEFLDVQTRNALAFGRFATEVIYDHDADDQERGKFHRFRPIDAATIKRTIKPSMQEVESQRKYMARTLEEEQEVPVDIETDPEKHYPWVQAIENRKMIFFSEDEMIVYNMFPSTDIEHNGYPLTPLDTCISSITTHLSIEAYSKLFFQNGRAAKGMLVIQSDDIDQTVLEDLKAQYSASINDVSNSFRTPIFGVAQGDSVNWVTTEASSKDGEFTFLYDQVSRNILSSFSMSPDELPGYGHLSRGTNQQTLSESSNEFKMTAARDTGLRPLILKIQDFFNQKLFPIIDAELSQLCTIQFSGLDAQTRDQEAVRLQQEAPLHMTQDEIQTAVDKEAFGNRLSGSIPLSERYQLILDKYENVGKILSEINMNHGAMIDPLLQYKRDPFYLQHLQLLMQVNPAAVQALYNKSPELELEIMKMLINDYLDEMGE